MKRNGKIAQNPTPWLRGLAWTSLIVRVVCFAVCDIIGFIPYCYGATLYVHWNDYLFRHSWLFGEIYALLPSLLFLIYLYIGFPFKKNHPVLLVSYGLFALQFLCPTWDYIKESFYGSYGTDLATDGVAAVFFTMTGFYLAFLIFVTMKFKHAKAAQVLIGIQAALSLIVNGVWLCLFVFSFVEWFSSFLMWLADLFMLVAHFLFWRYGVNYTAAQTIQQKLYTLKQKADRGAISEQEYAAQKAELLRKL